MKTERFHHQHICTIRNGKENPSGRRKMTPDENNVFTQRNENEYIHLHLEMLQ